MDRTDLRYISRRNLDIFAEGQYKKDDTKIRLPEMTTQYLDENVLLTVPSTPTTLDSTLPQNTQETKFIVTRLDSFESAKKLRDEPANAKSFVAVLNFASAKKPGGGFLNGAMAQEEALCYRSNLYVSLTSEEADQFYSYPSKPPVTYTHRMIYTANVLVFRDPDYELYAKDQVFCVDVITCAAVNRKICNGPDKDVLADKIMMERAWRIVALAAAQKVDHLVLGAWGCGVFGNSVDFVTRAFMDAITRDFRHSFKSVSFASPSAKNYQVMFKVVSEYAPATGDSDTNNIASSSAPAVAAPVKVLVGGQRVLRK